jgi:DNA repair photolyase
VTEGQNQPPRGRGSAANPPNRFERLRYDPSDVEDAQGDAAPRTEFLRDSSRSAMARNDSPDVGFTFSVNPYRGCEHGCSYCFARPTHEYLGFSAGLDFETKILVKEDAPALLRKELSSPRWTPQTIMMSGVTDPYQPVERRLGLTRKCLEVLAEFRNPVSMLTKNELISRDVDLLGELASFGAAAAFVSITTLDEDLGRAMEPRASTPSRRLAALSALSSAGIPCGVMVAPIVPGLTDHEMPSILEAAARHGAKAAGYVILRLPFAVAPLFTEWLERHRPSSKEKVLGRIRSMRGGDLYDSRYGVRQRGEGPFAEQIRRLFEVASRKHGLAGRPAALSTAAFRHPDSGAHPDQLDLFGGVP